MTQRVPFQHDAVSRAILGALWARNESGFEASLPELRAATAATRSRYGGTHRFTGALAMLARSDLIWTVGTIYENGLRIPPAFGLTQRAISLIESEGMESLLR
jgi:hypothetical protein